MPVLRRLPSLALLLVLAALVACGDDDGGTGPTTTGPGDVTIRLTHLIVFGTCEGASGLDQTGDFIVEMRVLGPDGSPLNLTPDPPSGGPNDLFQGDAGEIVPLDHEFVLDGAAADVDRLRIWFEVYERDGPDLFDDRMSGTRGSVDFVRNDEGTLDGLAGIASMYGASPCRMDFVITLEQ